MSRKSTIGGLMLALVLCCLTGIVAQAQEMPATPPVKMGLWETTITNTIGGIQIPPDIAAKMQAMGRPVPGSTPQTVVTHSCMTKEEWAKGFEKMNSNESKCTYSNRTITSEKISFDNELCIGAGRRVYRQFSDAHRRRRAHSWYCAHEGCDWT